MTLQEYDKQMDEATDKLRTNWSEELYHFVSEFQYKGMTELLATYKKTIGNDEAKQVCYDLLEYAVKYSESGSSIVDVETKELADRVGEIIMDEIGDFLLDPPEIYEFNDGWSIDCMFGGRYVPYWDGWRD